MLGACVVSVREKGLPVRRLGGSILFKQESHCMRFGWRERYESRGSRTILRGAGVKLPGLLTLNMYMQRF